MSEIANIPNVCEEIIASLPANSTDVPIGPVETNHFSSGSVQHTYDLGDNQKIESFLLYVNWEKVGTDISPFHDFVPLQQNVRNLIGMAFENDEYQVSFGFHDPDQEQYSRQIGVDVTAELSALGDNGSPEIFQYLVDHNREKLIDTLSQFTIVDKQVGQSINLIEGNLDKHRKLATDVLQKVMLLWPSAKS